MMAQIIDGKEIARKFREEIAIDVAKIKEKHGITPGLAVILVGQDPASQVYVANKEKAAKAVGMNSYLFRMNADVSQDELIAKIHELNNDKNVHGILVQLPVPKHIDTNAVIHAIDANKDVDGFNVVNVGKLSVGEITGDDAALVPCTPLGCLHLIKKTIGDDLVGLKTLVIGTSNIVGRPLARLLTLEKCTVTLANSSTRDLKAECLQADVIISAAGVPGLVKGDMIKDGAIVIDVGINRIQDENGKGKLVGDIDFESVMQKAKAVTPVPGGVGPMTISYLLKNTLNCCLKGLR